MATIICEQHVHVCIFERMLFVWLLKKLKMSDIISHESQQHFTIKPQS